MGSAPENRNTTPLGGVFNSSYLACGTTICESAETVEAAQHGAGCVRLEHKHFGVTWGPPCGAMHRLGSGKLHPDATSLTWWAHPMVETQWRQPPGLPASQGRALWDYPTASLDACPWF